MLLIVSPHPPLCDFPHFLQVVKQISFQHPVTKGVVEMLDVGILVEKVAPPLHPATAGMLAADSLMPARRSVDRRHPRVR